MHANKRKNTANYFLDANVFLRFLRLDGPISHQERATQIFDLIQKETITGSVHTLVISEVIYVLTGVYKVNKKKIVTALLTLLDLSNLNVLDVEKSVLKDALRMYAAHSIDFQDCFYHVLAENQGLIVASFDQDFLKLITKPKK